MLPLSIFLYINLYVIGKILVQDRRLSLKEGAYIVLTWPFVYLAAENFNYIALGIVVLLFLFFYFYKGKSYSFRKTITLTFVPLVSTAVAYQTVTTALWPIIALYFLFLYTLSIISISLLTKFFRKFRGMALQSEQLQMALLYIAAFFVISFQSSLSFSLRIGCLRQLSLGAVFFIAYVIASFASFLFFIRTLEKIYEAQRREDEQKNFQFYTDEIERQFTATRKFEHDYQNILFSLDSFIEEKDWTGLEQYYVSRIKTTSKAITKNNFALESLSKIKVKEIKGILIIKLMTAQKTGIDVLFEANEEIDSIPLDSVALVRVLGIILDNAIEELTELDAGVLMVGCFKEKTGVTFVVQNTCRPDIPKLHQLKEPGFSTKGGRRGLGLSNLSEIASSHPNITLETSIEENHFIQKLMIGGV